MKREICAAEKPNKIRKKDGVITALFYLFDFSCFRVGKVKKKSHYLLVIGAVGTAANLLCGSPHRRRVPGNPRRGFPTPKQSAGLFCLPSCAFAKEEISPCAQGDQRFYLWKPPPLKRRAKFYFRADSLQKIFFFARPDLSLYLADRDSPVPTVCAKPTEQAQKIWAVITTAHINLISVSSGLG